MSSNKSTIAWQGKLPAIAILLLLVAGAWWFSTYTTTPETNESATPPAATGFRSVGHQDHIRGRADAPYTIIEYGDIACEFCQAFHPRVQQLLVEHPDDIRWVWRWFPHDVNVDAYAKAEAGECAAEQGKFWEFIDAVFVTGTNVTIDELVVVADIVKLDTTAFEECSTSGRHRQQVEIDVAEASYLGGKATPFTLIITPDNQVYPLAGAASYEQLNGLLNDLKNGREPSFQYE